MRVLTKYILLVFLCAVAFPSFGQVKLPVSKKIVVSASGKVGGLTAEQFISRTMANPTFTRGLSAADQYALAQSLELALTRRIQSTVLPPSLPTPKLHSVATATQIVGRDYLHAVWELNNADGNAVAYFKMGNYSEIERTKQFHEIAKEIIPQFDLIDIQYSYVVAEGYQGLPALVEGQIKRSLDTDFFRRYVRESQTRAVTPFILSSVDVRGFTFSQQYNWSRPVLSLSILKNKPITSAEWAQVRGFVQAFNAAGFFHGDLPRNFHLRRGTDGRLKVTILDFEKNAAELNDELFFDEWEELLIEEGCLVL